MAVKDLLSGKYALLRLTCLFWLLAKILSYKVWLTDRLFPVTPVFGFLEHVPSFIHLLLFILSCLLLILLTVKPGKIAVYLLLLSEAAALLLDYTRWQPWEYQYLFIMLIFLLANNSGHIKTMLVIMMAALYFYSGLHKLNEGFLTQVWNNMILMSFLKLPHSLRANWFIHHAGYIIAVFEAILGILLLFRSSKKIAALLLIAIHVFNLIWLGPLGMHYNIIVWPWNCFMVIILYMLFIAPDKSEFTFILPRKPKYLFLVILWAVMPVLNFWGYWDHYLSGSLYSGKLPLMAFCINSAEAREKLAAYIKDHDTNNRCDGESLVKLQSWAMDELNVPPYPELRVYRKIKKALMQNYPGSKVYLYYYGKPQKYPL